MNSKPKMPILTLCCFVLFIILFFLLLFCSHVDALVREDVSSSEMIKSMEKERARSERNLSQAIAEKEATTITGKQESVLRENSKTPEEEISDNSMQEADKRHYRNVTLFVPFFTCLVILSLIYIWRVKKR